MTPILAKPSRSALFALCFLALPAQPSDKDLVTLTITATCLANAAFTDKACPIKDSVSLTLSERATYRIISDGPTGLKLELLQTRNSLGASGGGTQVMPPPFPPTTWTYIQPISTTPSAQGGVWIDTKRGQGHILFNHFAKGVKSSQEYAGSMALGVAEQAISFATSDFPLPPELAEPNTEFMKKLAFTFDPKARTFSAGGQASYTYRLKSQDPAVSGSANLQVSYQVTRGEVPDQGEVLVEVKGSIPYESWTPQGNLADSSKPGNTLQLSIRAHKAGNPKEPTKRRFRFTAELSDVSREPGVCLNWPEQASDALDLQILQTANAAWNVGSESKASTRDLLEKADLSIACFDYGAWGRLEITAEDEDGNSVPVRFQGRIDAPIPIPQDLDENRIADAWERWQKIEGDAAADEDDVPSGNGFPGDGLTAYEEYRGFAAKGKHVQGEPFYKDLFICDDTSGSATGGIALLKRIEDLKIHLVTREELGKERVINRHHGQGPHAVDQHGILILRGGNNSAEAVEAYANAPFGPPKYTDHIQLPEAMPGGSVQKVWDHNADVAHEICHSIGVQHHGDNLQPVFWGWLEDASKPGTWTLMEFDLTGDSDARQSAPTGTGRRIRVIRESDGTELKHGEDMPDGSEYRKSLGGYRLLIVGKHGECSGDESCIMRYMDRQAYLSEKTQDLRILPDPSRWEARTSLCVGKSGHSLNSKKNLPEPRYGDAVRGNCLSQIVVNDRFVPKGP